MGDLFTAVGTNTVFSRSGSNAATLASARSATCSSNPAFRSCSVSSRHCRFLPPSMKSSRLSRIRFFLSQGPHRPMITPIRMILCFSEDGKLRPGFRNRLCPMLGQLHNFIHHFVEFPSDGEFTVIQKPHVSDIAVHDYPGFQGECCQ